MSLHNLTLGGTDKAYADISADFIECNNLNVSGDVGITLNQLSDVDIPTPNNGDLLTYDSISGNWEAQPGSGGSPVNSASNVGIGTGQVFKALAGTDLEFKTVQSGQNIVVTNNADEVNIGLDMVLSEAEYTPSFSGLTGISNINVGTAWYKASGSSVDVYINGEFNDILGPGGAGLFAVNLPPGFRPVNNWSTGGTNALNGGGIGYHNVTVGATLPSPMFAFQANGSKLYIVNFDLPAGTDTNVPFSLHLWYRTDN